MKVKDLIKELQKCDPEKGIDLLFYGESGRGVNCYVGGISFLGEYEDEELEENSYVDIVEDWNSEEPKYLKNTVILQGSGECYSYD